MSAAVCLTRLRDARRWRSQLLDVTIWALFGLTITHALSLYAPGYPIIVGTSSVPTGLYWLTKDPGFIRSGDLITFQFRPADWLKSRYGEDKVHTKIALGVPGQLVKADDAGSLEVCATDAVQEVCRSAGKPLAQDSKGRPMRPWLAPGQQYRLKPQEYWVYSPHPRSLDSRYEGPVPRKAIRGTAKAVWLFSID